MPLMAANSEVFSCNKQVGMVEEMLNTMDDPLELWRYAADRKNQKS